MRQFPQMITNQDLKRLLSILDDEALDPKVVARIEDRLSALEIVDLAAVPEDLVTMNSVIKGIVSDDAIPSTHERIITLVFPRSAAISDGRISVVTPLGAELLGVRTGERVTWQGHDGARRTLKVDSVIYQPEANGDWNL